MRYSPLYEKLDSALGCKNSKRQPTCRKIQVSVVADMRFRGVASLNQVGAQFWCWGTGEASSKGPTAGDSWRGGSKSPSSPARVSGERCIGSPSGVRGRTLAAESFSCILCHQIASPSTSAYSCSCVLSCLCLHDCNTCS